jgi:hypothetical protein
MGGIKLSKLKHKLAKFLGLEDDQVTFTYTQVVDAFIDEAREALDEDVLEKYAEQIVNFLKQKGWL